MIHRERRILLSLGFACLVVAALGFGRLVASFFGWV